MPTVPLLCVSLCYVHEQGASLSSLLTPKLADSDEAQTHLWHSDGFRISSIMPRDYLEGVSLYNVYVQGVSLPSYHLLA